MTIKRSLMDKTMERASHDMGYLVGYGISGQPLLRKSTNAPKVYVRYGEKGKRTFGSPACGREFARSIKGYAILVVDDGEFKQMMKYVNGFFVKTKTEPSKRRKKIV